MAANFILLLICVTLFTISAMVLYPEPLVWAWNGAIDCMVWVIDLLLVKVCGEERPID